MALPGQPYGEEARDCLDHVIGGRTVQVDAYDPVLYKRILAVVWDGPVNVNLLSELSLHYRPDLTGTGE